MSGQHVGGLSDAINHEDDGGARRRLARATKPTGTTYRGGPSKLGDGDNCPVEGHGAMIVLYPSNTQWCPVQTHDMGQPRDATGNDWRRSEPQETSSAADEVSEDDEPVALVHEAAGELEERPLQGKHDEEVGED